MNTFKGTPGEWTISGRFVQAPNKNGGMLQLGQSFVMELPRHENKFTEDVEGLANAKLFAASKRIGEALQGIVTHAEKEGLFDEWEKECDGAIDVGKSHTLKELLFEAKAALSAALD
jgi:hypothetical protein